MESDQQPIEALIFDLAEKLATGAVASQLLLDGSLEDFARKIVVDRLARNMISAQAGKYGVIAKWPVRTHEQLSVRLAPEFWQRWRESPADRRWYGNDFRWTNGDRDLTGEVAMGVTVATSDADRLIRLVERFELKHEGGKQSPHTVSSVTAAVTAILKQGLDIEPPHTGPSVAAEIRKWFEDRDKAPPSETTLVEQALAILRELRGPGVPDEGAAR